MASNRLRRRLEEGEGSTGNVNENFCMIGTPLPSLASTKRDANEFKPVWQQEAYDEQGRRRFHGAFTGGWSAGYFNTVGSKEGWTPSAFRSSRKGKGQHGHAQQSVDDFMDEEDREDLRQGRGTIKTKDTLETAERGEAEYDPLLGLFGGERGTSKASEATASFGRIELTRTSLGTQILQRMGWKQGQGLGPRISAKQRRSLRALLGQPCEEESDLIDDSTHTFAPPDTPLVQVSSSTDTSKRYGLGWRQSDRPATLAEILQKRRNNHVSIRDGPFKKGAGGFGIGALENDSDGEEDIYDTGDDSQRSMLNGPSRSQATRQSTESQRKVDVGQDKENVWHDGQPMIPGFRVASLASPPEPWFEGPTVPPGWRPDPRRVWSRYREPQARSSSSAHVGPTERALALGEARAPGPPPIISDYLSRKDQQRLARATLRSSDDETQRTDGDAPVPAPFPKIDRTTAQAALRGFIPFANEPEKEERYRAYLTSQAYPDSGHAVAPLPGQRREAFLREINEFAKSAAVFKPMSTMMANRFESSNSRTIEYDAAVRQEGLYVPKRTGNDEKVQGEEKSKAETGKEGGKDAISSSFATLSPARRNARMGFFGPGKTRETKEWAPSRLLCKRFNVPMPYADARPDRYEEQAKDGRGPGTEERFDEFGESRGRAPRTSLNVNARWEASKRELQSLAASRAWEAHEKREGDQSGSNEAQRAKGQGGEEMATEDVDGERFSIGFGELVKEGEETTYTRPPLSLFKAIFDDEESEAIKERDHAMNKAKKTVQEDAAGGGHRLTFVPRKRAKGESSRTESAEQLASTGKKSKRRQNASSARGMLTFDLDEEEGEGKGDWPKTSRKRERKVSQATPGLNTSAQSREGSRMRASDLFD